MTNSSSPVSKAKPSNGSSDQKLWINLSRWWENSWRMISPSFDLNLKRSCLWFNFYDGWSARRYHALRQMSSARTACVSESQPRKVPVQGLLENSQLRTNCAHCLWIVSTLTKLTQGWAGMTFRLSGTGRGLAQQIPKFWVRAGSWVLCFLGLEIFQSCLNHQVFLFSLMQSRSLYSWGKPRQENFKLLTATVLGCFPMLRSKAPVIFSPHENTYLYERFPDWNVYLRIFVNSIPGYVPASLCLGKLSPVKFLLCHLVLSFPFLPLLLPLKILHKQAKLQGPIPPEENSAGWKTCALYLTNSWLKAAFLKSPLREALV